MARLDDLVGRVTDAPLRRELEQALAEVKRRQRFGLVFEQHLPEVTALPGLPIQVGSLVQCRHSNGNGNGIYQVQALTLAGAATVVPLDGGEAEQQPIEQLSAIKRFGDPMYPALTSLGSVRAGLADKPHHAVVNAENYHALQLLAYLYEGQVDCIYLDPPYNTGARDWKYNNHYVDDSDVWRHSKWLSFMEKRLRLAKRLLKPDGVLILTIDEHEVHHLGMLLEKPGLFPEYLRYMVTIVISARGNYKKNFARVEEYAFFCCPNIDRDVIVGTRLELLPESDAIDVDLNADDEDEAEEVIPEVAESLELPLAELANDEDNGAGSESSEVIELRHARRRGPDSSRRDRPSMFYPIYIDEKAKRVVRAGPPIPLDAEPDFAIVDGLRPVWPIDAEGAHRRWRWGHDRMQKAILVDGVQLGKHNRRLDSWTINVVVRRQDNYKKLKTVWRHSSHDAGTHGTALLDNILGQRGLFPFPKSVYAVRDCLAAVVRERPNALIVDCFAGSGTTLHATCLLNAEDAGNRRCILVTNNEVTETVATQLNAAGHYRGDPAYEAQGIFERVTRPRCEAVIKGQRPDGTPIPGSHVDGRPLAQGFPENVTFFRLDYLNPNDVDLGRRFNAIVPALWLTAGGVEQWEFPDEGQPFTMPSGSTYGVLFQDSHFREFQAALDARPDVTHVWLVTDSEDAYAEMRSVLPRHLSIGMLYRDYLRSFRINTERNL